MRAAGFFDALGVELGSAFDRLVERRRRRRRLAQRVGAAAAVVAVALTALVAIDRDHPAEAGVQVERRDGFIYVRLTDLEHRPRVIEDAVRKAGLDVAVTAVPTGPSLVGRFVRVGGSGDLKALLRLEPDGSAFGGFAVPEGWDGRLVLEVGEPARDGEAYAVFTNALSEGEPLACTGIAGSEPAEATAIVRARDLAAHWKLVSGLVVEDVDLDDLTVRQQHELQVSHVLGTGVRDVLVYLSGDATPPRGLPLTEPAHC